MTPTHTPGPWHSGGTMNPGTLEARKNIWGPTPPGLQSGELIAKDVRPCNAHLISMAPEIAEALHALLLWVRANSDEMTILKCKEFHKGCVALTRAGL